jgi:predicted  nucleic acid-binding Zn-ribbon protein
VTDAAVILQLHDIDLLLHELAEPRSLVRLKKLGFEIDPRNLLERARARCVTAIERRWISVYERALRRYGRAVAIVRGRVCQGCFITLPTSACVIATESLTMCESCGRILYWR